MLNNKWKLYQLVAINTIKIKFSTYAISQPLLTKFHWYYAYLIFVIFFTQAKFLENKIYTEKRQFFALNL